MAERRIEHAFECDPEAYWELFFSAEFNRKLFLERLRFQRWEVTKTEPTAHGFRRRVEAEPPPLNLPGPLARVFKGGIGYSEDGEYDKDRSLYTLRAVSNSLPDRLLVSGEISVVPDPRGCKRIYVSKVTAKVFGVGGLIEDRVLSDLERSLNKAAEFTEKWLKEHQA